MPATLSEIVSGLCQASPEELLQSAAALLSEERDWLAAVRNAVAAISKDEIHSRTARVRVANVQPHVFPLHEEPSCFMIVVNHYNRSLFDEQFKQGHITPHYHHFSFCSRVLRGGFLHFLFENQGSLSQPRLSPAGYKRLEAGDVFTMDYDQFHCVLAPEQDTVTLMVRSAPRFLNPHLGDFCFDLDRAWLERNELLCALEHRLVRLP